MDMVNTCMVIIMDMDMDMDTDMAMDMGLAMSMDMGIMDTIKDHYQLAIVWIVIKIAMENGPPEIKYSNVL